MATSTIEPKRNGWRLQTRLKAWQEGSKADAGSVTLFASARLRDVCFQPFVDGTCVSFDYGGRRYVTTLERFGRAVGLLGRSYPLPWLGQLRRSVESMVRNFSER
jgi:hypothetical protein